MDTKVILTTNKCWACSVHMENYGILAQSQERKGMWYTLSWNFVGQFGCGLKQGNLGPPDLWDEFLISLLLCLCSQTCRYSRCLCPCCLCCQWLLTFSSVSIPLFLQVVRIHSSLFGASNGYLLRDQ